MNLFETKNKTRSRTSEPLASFTQDPRLVCLSKPSSAAAEAYRNVRANLLHASGREEAPRLVVVTSPEPGVARSLACANLAVTLAQAGKRTALVDCDLRDPRQRHIFGIDGGWSVDELFAGDLSLPGAFDEPLPDLKLFAAGGVVADPASVLESECFSELLSELREECDRVLIDAPCMEDFSDAIPLAVQSDGVLLVVESRKSRKAPLRKSVRRLNEAGAEIIGTVAVNA